MNDALDREALAVGRETLVAMGLAATQADKRASFVSEDLQRRAAHHAAAAARALGLTAAGGASERSFLSREFIFGLCESERGIRQATQRALRTKLEVKLLKALRPGVRAPIEFGSQAPTCLTPFKWKLGFRPENRDEAFALLGFAAAFLRQQEIALGAAEKVAEDIAQGERAIAAELN